MSAWISRHHGLIGCLLAALAMLGCVYAVYRCRRQRDLNAALFRSIRELDSERVERLLSSGAEANCRDTAFALPRNAGLLGFLERLIHPLSPDQIGPTPLMELICRVDLNYNDSMKFALINHPQPRIVRALIARGAEVNVEYPEYLKWSNKTTGTRIPLLTVAIERSDYATVNDLVADGARVNEPPLSSKDYMYAPLYEAIVLKRVDVVKLLVSAGADLNTRSPAGETGLGVAMHLAKEVPRSQHLKSIAGVIAKSGGRL